ncbi:MAG: hypothetical protein M1814_000158 [Vezdaea aestivalis]|nr:MAG: hypothetical protein M1814_000158 [Vezdaea aestivalis]
MLKLRPWQQYMINPTTVIHYLRNLSPTSTYSTKTAPSIGPFGGESVPESLSSSSTSPFYLETGYSLFAKRPSRPFPPPFSSPPSQSFSDPLSTHRNRDRRPSLNGEPIRGLTNGDDAILAGSRFIIAADGVGAWAAKPKGQAALWSRLILHFWSLEAESAYQALLSNPSLHPSPITYLQRAYEATIRATSPPNPAWYGTTTACSALLHHDTPSDGPPRPILYITNLGDSQVLVLRPGAPDPLFKTEEQWHWFDCPRQLGTNSPDTPEVEAVMKRVEVQVGDVVLAMSDGVVDNLWEHEIVESVEQSLEKGSGHGDEGVMKVVASELVKAARAIAEDRFAESPFMERAIEEGLAMEGGKLDDISVVAAICRRSEL